MNYFEIYDFYKDLFAETYFRLRYGEGYRFYYLHYTQTGEFLL